MSSVHFRWNWGAVITRRISSLFRRARDDDKESHSHDRGPVTSEPHVRIRRPQTSGAGSASSQPSGSLKRKGKQRAARPTSPIPYVSKNSRSKSTEPRQIRRRDPGTSSMSALHGPSQYAPQSSTCGLAENSQFVSSQSSPTPSDKPRARFGFLFNPILHWRPNKYTSQGTSSTNTTTVSSLTDGSIRKRVDVDIGTQTSRGKVTRRSEEALRHSRYNPSSGEEGGGLTADRRASSWGQGDQPAEFAGVLNFQSIRHDPSDRALRSAGQSGPHSDQSSFVPRTPSGLSNVAVILPSKEPVFDEEQQFGPACFDEDSSTIASAYGKDEDWQHGSDLEEDDNGDDDSDDQDENAVTFLSRRR